MSNEAIVVPENIILPWLFISKVLCGKSSKVRAKEEGGVIPFFKVPVEAVSTSMSVSN